nr:MAG TPA: hypothetical protein [Caudoviricetes sp.]
MVRVGNIRLNITERKIPSELLRVPRVSLLLKRNERKTTQVYSIIKEYYSFCLKIIVVGDAILEIASALMLLIFFLNAIRIIATSLFIS